MKSKEKYQWNLDEMKYQIEISKKNWIVSIDIIKKIYLKISECQKSLIKKKYININNVQISLLHILTEI